MRPARRWDVSGGRHIFLIAALSVVLLLFRGVYSVFAFTRLFFLALVLPAIGIDLILRFRSPVAASEMDIKTH